MKFFRLNILTALFFTVSSLGFSQVGINTIAPDTSASLHIVSKPSGSGLIIPELTQAQRLAIFNPAQGLMVFDLSANLFYMNMTAGVHDWYAINPWLTKGNNTAPDVMYTSPVVTKVGIGISNPATALDVVGDINASASVIANSVSASTLTIGSFPVNSLVPAGAIMMWSGTTAPSGWALCDGTSGTPNLKGRFIVGYDASSPTGPAVAATDGIGVNYGTPGNTGGETGHTLLSSESGVPSHTHTSVPHRHQQLITTSNGNGTQIETNQFASGSNRALYVNWSSDYGGGQNTAVQTVSINPNTVQDASVTHENRPPYYVLAYIIKLP